MDAEPLLRRARPDDAVAVAEVWLRAFDAALPTVQRAHDDDDVRGWVRDVLLPEREVWVAEDSDQEVVAVLALSDGWLEQLYVRPDRQGRGTGDRLVALAKRRQPAGLQLWTFQANARAQRFYERRGFVAVERTDGAGNEERAPDVRYAWTPPPGQPRTA